ncbi:hypothetical protein ACGF8B_32355 [Streptomyces sp. NPDC047917]|uniref:hypothetical protein n=1 Tax=Streptomyces sp. NPDC047917 TaxID=3365491 RepID=UPI00371A98C8
METTYSSVFVRANTVHRVFPSPHPLHKRPQTPGRAFTGGPRTAGAGLGDHGELKSATDRDRVDRLERAVELVSGSPRDLGGFRFLARPG